MQGFVRLYGNIAAGFHDDKNHYQSLNGVLDIPESLVAAALQVGFTRSPTFEHEPLSASAIVAGVVAALPSAASTPSDELAKVETSDVGAVAGGEPLDVARRDTVLGMLNESNHSIRAEVLDCGACDGYHDSVDLRATTDGERVAFETNRAFVCPTSGDTVFV